MPVIAGNTILAAEYNTLRSTVSGILATNYGQTLTSTTAAAGTTPVSVAKKLDLFLDIQRTHVHHTGALNTTIAVPSTGVTIAADTSESYNQSTGVRAAITDGTRMGYNDFDAATVSLSNFNPSTDNIWPASSFSLGTAISSARSTAWGGAGQVQKIYHEVTVTFANEAAKNHYLNAGGEIRFTAALSGGSGAKDTDWASLLASIGTVRFNKWRLTADSGTPAAGGSGADSLTSTYRLIFTKSGSGVYADNFYYIEARNDSTSVIRFRVQFDDGDVGTGNPLFPEGDPIDESVGGTTSSTIRPFRPDSSFTYNATSYTAVSLPAPTIASTILLTEDL